MKLPLFLFLILQGLPMVSLGKNSNNQTVDVVSNIRSDARSLAAKGQIREALTSLKTGISILEREFTPNTVIAEVQTQFTEYRKEIVTRTEEKDRNVSLGIESLFSSIFGFGQAWKRSRVDVTKIVTVNPAEAAQFPARIQSDLRTLKEKVHNHIALHINEIVLAKFMALEAYRMIAADDTRRWTSRISANDLKVIDEVSQTYLFGGVQNITACISTDYADHSSHHDEGESLSVGLLFFKLGYLNQKTSTTTYYAHNETQCTFSNTTIWESSAPYMVVDLNQLDERIAQWRTQAMLRLQYSNEPQLEQRTQPFQTWGIE